MAEQQSAWPERVPDAEDWNAWGQDPEDLGDLDLRYAHEEFFGKNWQDCVSMFGESPIERTENLRRMPLVPFRYYLRAFAVYLESQHALDPDNIDRSSAASCFLDIVEERLRENREYVLPLMHEILPRLERVVGLQEAFDADEDIFGNFAEQLERIRNLL